MKSQICKSSAALFLRQQHVWRPLLIALEGFPTSLQAQYPCSVRMCRSCTLTPSRVYAFSGSTPSCAYSVLWVSSLRRFLQASCFNCFNLEHGNQFLRFVSISHGSRPGDLCKETQGDGLGSDPLDEDEHHQTWRHTDVLGVGCFGASSGHFEVRTAGNNCDNRWVPPWTLTTAQSLPSWTGILSISQHVFTMVLVHCSRSCTVSMFLVFLQGISCHLDPSKSSFTLGNRLFLLLCKIFCLFRLCFKPFNFLQGANRMVSGHICFSILGFAVGCCFYVQYWLIPQARVIAAKAYFEPLLCGLGPGNVSGNPLLLLRPPPAPNLFMEVSSPRDVKRGAVLSDALASPSSQYLPGECILLSNAY